MNWSYKDQEAETWLRLANAESPHRSEMETRQGQADALERLHAHWDKALSKQARDRALVKLSIASHLAPKPQIQPLRWPLKTGSTR